MAAFGARFLTLGLVTTALAFIGPRPVSTALESPQTSPNMQVRVDGDWLTVKLKDAPLKAVLEEIGRQGRIEVVIQGALPQKVSAEFGQSPLEEGLTRLLRGCGSVAVGRKNGKAERLVVTALPEGGSRSAPRGGATRVQPGTYLAPDGGPVVRGQRPNDPARALARLMERKALKTFFAVLVTPSDSVVKLDAFGDVVDSLSLEEVGDLIGLLQDKTVPPSKWEDPLADVLTAEQRTLLGRFFRDVEVRRELIKSFQQVQLFKIAQAREARERERR